MLREYLLKLLSIQNPDLAGDRLDNLLLNLAGSIIDRRFYGIILQKNTYRIVEVMNNTKSSQSKSFRMSYSSMEEQLKLKRCIVHTVYTAMNYFYWNQRVSSSSLDMTCFSFVYHVA